MGPIWANFLGKIGHFGSIWHPLGRSWGASPRGTPLGPLSHEKSSPFLMKKTVEFVAALRMHFDSENRATWVPKWS